MKQSDRTYLIREGNKLFNDGNINEAQKYFMKADYQGGMLRVADHYFYDQKLPLNALPLYIKCGSKKRIEEIYQRMAFALGKLIQQDKKSDQVDSTDNEAGDHESRVEKEIIESIPYKVELNDESVNLGTNDLIDSSQNMISDSDQGDITEKDD